jgi:hypothetical protein
VLSALKVPTAALTFLLLLLLTSGAQASSNMTELTRINGEGSPQQIAVVGNYAYVAAYDRLMVFDVSSPGDPELVNTLYISGASFQFNLNSVIAGNGVLYVGAGTQGLHVYSLSNPASPVLANTVPGATAGRMYRRLARLYVCAGYSGLQIYDVGANPSLPELIGSWSEPDVPVGDVEVNGDYAYLATAEWDWDVMVSTLTILNISQPQAPAFVSRWDGSDGGALWYDPGYIAVAGCLSVCLHVLRRIHQQDLRRLSSNTSVCVFRKRG